MTKYHSKPIEIDGHKFASLKEGKRYTELKLLERSGAIQGLKLHPVYVLAPSVVIQGRKKPELRYVADFEYTKTSPPDSPWGFLKTVEDVKGILTPVYRIKRHLMKSVHGIDILET